MIRVSVPATSANVCIGFDSLGLALDWWAHFRFEKSDSLTITGCPEKFCNRDNLVIKGFEAVCQKLDRELPSFHLDIDTDIPFSRGLGSSATCIVAGILAADAWFDAHLTKSEMLNLAASLEGHADNVAAALYGHLVVTYKQNDVWKLTLIPCKTWNMLALIPDYPVSTEEARTLIPDKVLLGEASLQTAHAIAFCSALASGDQIMLTSAAEDFLHEPYRSSLIKEYADLRSFCHSHGFPLWISGSGSTMLAMSKIKPQLDQLKSYVENTYPSIQVKPVTISQKGAYVAYE